jgi:hypothetical protein
LHLSPKATVSKRATTGTGKKIVELVGDPRTAAGKKIVYASELAEDSSWKENGLRQ